jgi:hypothetical protein
MKFNVIGLKIEKANVAELIPIKRENSFINMNIKLHETLFTTHQERRIRIFLVLTYSIFMGGMRSNIKKRNVKIEILTNIGSNGITIISNIGAIIAVIKPDNESSKIKKLKFL